MNCDKCKHMKRIVAALRPCQECEAGKLHSQVHVDGWQMDRAAALRSDGKPRAAFDRPFDETAQGASGCTALRPQDEERLNAAMKAIFDLDPVELLMLQHMMRGGSFASFSVVMLKMLRRLQPKEAELRGERDGFRQLAKAWADKIVAKAPILRPVIRARIDAK